MEASRAEYHGTFKQQLGHRESSTSSSEPSSSGASELTLIFFLFPFPLIVSYSGNSIGSNLAMCQEIYLFFCILVGIWVDFVVDSGSSGSETKPGGRDQGLQDSTLSSSMQIVLSMGFSYLQAIEAYSIFGDDVDSMVCYLLETSSSSRRKGKATEWWSNWNQKWTSETWECTWLLCAGTIENDQLNEACES